MRVIARMNVGGPAHQVALLSGRRLDPARYDVLLVHGSVPEGEESMADRADAEGAKAEFVRELGPAISPYSDMVALRRLRKIVRDFKPDIVHTHTAKAGFLGRRAALAGSPVPAIVHTYHGHVLRGYFGPARSRAYLELERRLARRSDRLIGVSQATVDELVDLGVAPRSRFQVVPLGLDLSQFAALPGEPGEEARLRLGVDSDDVVCAWIGRFAPIKRPEFMLEAFARAHAAEAKLRLVMVGDGPLRAEAERQAADLGVAGRVHFLGYRRDLAQIMSATDIVALSSANEGTPVALIEAGAAARPTVSTDVGGVAAVVDGTGVLAPPRDPIPLGAALAELAADPKRRRELGAAGRARMLREFSADRLVADIDRLYTELSAAAAADA